MLHEEASGSGSHIGNLAFQHYVVGIGSSAGGLEAIQEVFENMPSDAGFSFIVLQHMASDHVSKLDELLSKLTPLPVLTIEEGMDLLENKIFIMPSNKNIVLYKNKFHLREKEFGKPNMPIDLFFESLSEEKGEKSIGIILSGTGEDGTKGIKAIKNAGGIVLVQDPQTALFPSMPESAISTHLVDYVLSPTCIRDELLACCEKDSMERKIADSLLQQEETVLFEILDYIKRKTPYDFTHYKRPTILRRLARRISFLNLPDFASYLSYIVKHQEEILILCKEFLIGVTRFFRDREAFEELENNTIPSIIKAKNYKEPVKVWVTGCSTGEEAYSIAILFKEYFRRSLKEVDVKIFASDIDTEAIDFAIKGVYGEHIEKDVSQDWLDRYFIKEGAQYRIHPDVRKMIIFSHHDVIKDVPFGKTDLISCRNMLIYMDPSLQQKCLSLFHYSLNMGGYLILGPSESIGELKQFFLEINKRWNIYQNAHPSKGIRVDTVHSLIQKHYTVKENSIKNSTQNVFIENLLKVVLEQTDSAGIYIDSNFQIIDTFGKYKKYLQLPDEKLELYLLKMLPKDLSIILGTSIRKAIKINERIEINDLKIEGREDACKIVIQPFLSDKKINQNVCLILFSDSKVNKPNYVSPQFNIDPSLNIEHFLALEQELKETKQILQRAIEEAETSNEELQSSNEELVSANEEMQSTNEELQSVNEELHTVNAENALRIKEAIELNDDLNNYFRSSDMSQIFLDKNLIIRKLTPAATAQINLIESDIGRSISHISNNIKSDELFEIVNKVIETAESIEKEVEMKDKRWCHMKVLPYLKAGKVVDGIVITFHDISNLKNLNTQLESLIENQHAILENITDGIVACDENGNLTLFNKATRKFHGLSESSTMPKEWANYYSLYNPDGTPMITEEVPLYKAFNGQEVKDIEMVIAPENGEKRHLLANGQQMVSPDGKVLGAVVAMHDITDQKRVEAELRSLNLDLELKVKERTLELDQKNKSLEVLNKIGKAISTEFDLSTIVQIVTDEATSITGAQFGAFFYNVLDEKGESYTLYTISGVDRDKFANFPMPRNTKVFAPTFEGTGIVRVDDITKDPRYGKNDPYYGMPKGHLPVASYLAVPVVSRNGKVLGGLFFGHSQPGIFSQRSEDVVSAIAAQAAIGMDNASLYASTNAAKEALAVINKELSIKNDELQSINVELDNFVYTASHDLKSPVSNIEGLVTALDEQLQDERSTKEDIKMYLKMIQESTNRFSQTIKDLTTISKMQKEEGPMDEDIDLLDLLENVKIDVQDLLQESNATIEIDCRANPSVYFSRKNLRSILYNLLSNALKYRATERAPIVRIETEEMDDFIVIKVQDNGMGISKAQQEKLFGLFKRFHHHIEGSGIGLYLVKRIIESARGKVEVESELGIGSIFRVYIKKEV